jgi:ubiquinol-cytochrome c reductase cytochrome b subunit
MGQALKKFIFSMLGIALLVAFSTLEAQEPAGPDLVKRLSCLGCHALAGKGGKRGPAWDGLGTRLSPEAIRQQVVSPQGNMPNYAHLKPEELKALVEYLSGLK